MQGFFLYLAEVTGSNFNDVDKEEYDEKKTSAQLYSLLGRRQCGSLPVPGTSAVAGVGSRLAAAWHLCGPGKTELENHVNAGAGTHNGSSILGVE
jgi:hypothetical protein